MKLKSSKISKAHSSKHPAFDKNTQHKMRRLAMIKEAVHLFNRAGFYATTVDEIAGTVGVSRATLYHYFNNKTELLYECYLYALESGRQAVERATECGGTGIEQLEAYIRYQFESLATNDGATWILSDMSVLTDSQRLEVKKRSRIVDKMLQQLIQNGINDGSIGVKNPKITEFYLIGSLNWLPRWYRPDGQFSSSELAEMFLDFSLDGLKSR